MHGAALWAFIGTLAGALIGASAALGSQWMFQRNENKRHETERQREAVRALRTIELELGRATAVIEDALVSGDWWPDGDAPTSKLWRANAGTAGVALEREDWAEVAHAFDLLDRLELKRPPFNSVTLNPPRLSVDDRDAALDANHQAEMAHDILKKVDPQSGFSQLLRVGSRCLSARDRRPCG